MARLMDLLLRGGTLVTCDPSNRVFEGDLLISDGKIRALGPDPLLDGIDPSVVPGVILPAFGGLTYQQMLDVIHGVAARGRRGAAAHPHRCQRAPWRVGGAGRCVAGSAQRHAAF